MSALGEGLPNDAGCVFCQKIAERDFDLKMKGCVVFEPLNPVTAGHRLVVPVGHWADAALYPAAAARAMNVAALLARSEKVGGLPQANIITSIGEHATQTVRHIHIHLVPRRPGDGLILPWTGQKAKAHA